MSEELPQDLLDLHAKAMKMLEGIVSDFGITFEQAGQIAQRVTDYHRPLWDKRFSDLQAKILAAVEGLPVIYGTYEDADESGVVQFSKVLSAIREVTG